MNKNNRDITCQVAVIGGGLAGVCAAIASAREGAKTVLVHDRSVLGGNSGSEIGVPIGGADHIGAYRFARETGIINELLLENAYFPNYSDPETSQGFSGSVWDIVLRTAVRKEPNITLLMNATAKSPEVQNNRILSIIADQHSTEREYKIHSDYYIDCSGDGRVAYESGARCTHGQEGRGVYGESLAPENADNRTMGCSVYMKVRDTGRPMPFTPPSWAHIFHTDEDFPGGWKDCPHEMKQLLGCPGGYWWLEYGGEFDTIHDAEYIHDRLLAYAVGVWDHLKNRGDHGADNYVLDWISPVSGKRESRRFYGDSVLCQSDLETLRMFTDVVAYGGWNIDIHYPHGISGKGLRYWHGKDVPGRYGIPLSCLYSENIDNLLFAGRNISVSHVALGSTRVMATCALLGQAVGVCAAMCAHYCQIPRDIRTAHIHELQNKLLWQDAYLPGLALKDTANLAPLAKASSSSQERLVFPDPEMYISADTALYQAFFAKELDAVTLPLENNTSEPMTVKLCICAAGQLDHFFDAHKIDEAEAVLPPGHHHVRFTFCNTSDNPCRQLMLIPQPGLAWGFSEHEPVATCRAVAESNGFIRRKRGTCCLIPEPESRCYGPEQAVSGVNRPEKQSNVWISEAGFPQWYRLDWMEAVEANAVQLVLDDNLDRPLRRITDHIVTPELVKDYSIEVLAEDQWLLIAQKNNNYQRVNLHSFSKLKITALRVVFHGSNGLPQVRLTELRVKNDLSGEEK